MNLNFLYFLGEPWFVIPWYVIGGLGLCYVIYDFRHDNTSLKPAMKLAWPIIVLFFSVIGLALYFATARAPNIAKMPSEEERKKAHDRYEERTWRRVNGAVIHCVAGDGLGIMTAMVIARAGGMSFWEEFWFEYLVGFVIGWAVFQRKSMTMMTDSLPKQLAMAFRGEFFSMLTVMAGMGAVMTYVTPLVVTSQPKPLTYAFWGFGMFGLLVGFVFTYPMNWMMVKLGWKHGMGGMQGAKQKQVESAPEKVGLVAAMVILGGAAMVLPAWLTKVREAEAIRGSSAPFVPSLDREPGQALYEGTLQSLDDASTALHRGDRSRATRAIDDAMRAAEAGSHSAPGSFYSALEQIKSARIALWLGRESEAEKKLERAATVLRPAEDARPRTSASTGLAALGTPPRMRWRRVARRSRPRSGAGGAAPLISQAGLTLGLGVVIERTFRRFGPGCVRS